MNITKQRETLIHGCWLPAICLALVFGLPLATQAAQTHITQVARLAAPPEGKCLVNIYRIAGQGPWGANIRIPIFDESGKFLMDLPKKSECQLVFEPGKKSLITWFGSNPVNVLTADLAPNKTYDLVFDISVFKGGTYLLPLSQAGHDLPELEKKVETRIYALERDEAALAFETSQKAHVAQISADFLGGRKSDRVIHVSKDDCR
jgi:hypothetical protein